MSTQHRCRSKQFSRCSGKTSVCSGKKEGYKRSDLAHNISNDFYKFHTHLFNKYKTKTIQLHETQRDDISYIFSTGQKKNMSQEFISNKISNYYNSFNSSLKSVSCQNGYQYLCGSTNTVGRFINGSTDSCKYNANDTSGNFLHIEQNFRLFLDKQYTPTQYLLKIINKYY